MELQFPISGQIATGANPAAVHMSDNSVWAFRVQDGRLQGEESPQGPGDIDYSLLSWADFAVVTRDENISLMRLKNVPRLGIYGAWHQDPVLGEALQEITPERHRFAIWHGGFDPSDYLVSGSLYMGIESPVYTVNLQFSNPNGVLVGEDAALFHPGVEIDLEFHAGDSEPYPMGKWFADKAQMATPGGAASVEGRNITGKVLGDQTFNTANNYPGGVLLSTTVEAILQAAGLTATDYKVQPTPGYNVGMKFPPSMSILEGIGEILKTSRNWVIRERFDGVVVIGSHVSYTAELPQVSKYTFNRGEDIFSREVMRDDVNSYAKICVAAEVTDPITSEIDTVYHYETIVPAGENWAIPANRTLWIAAPAESTAAEMQDIAEELAERLASAGTVESFVGPWRPHLLIGDEAEIIGDYTKLLGTITQIRHRFGKSGFFTEFTVDSGGRIGKPQIRDAIDEINKGSLQPPPPKRLF